MKRYKLSSIATAISLDPNTTAAKQAAARHLLRDILSFPDDGLAMRVSTLSFTIADMLGVSPPRLHESDARFLKRVTASALKTAKAYGLKTEEVGDAK